MYSIILFFILSILPGKLITWRNYKYILYTFTSHKFVFETKEIRNFKKFQLKKFYLKDNILPKKISKNTYQNSVTREQINYSTLSDFVLSIFSYLSIHL